MNQKLRKLFTAFTVICSVLTSCKENEHEQCPSVSEASAGEDQTISPPSTLLAANVPESGSGLWSIVSGEGGNITDPTNATSTFTGLPDTQYSLRWTIKNECGSTSEDDVTIAFNNEVNRLVKRIYLNGELYIDNTHNSNKQLENLIIHFAGQVSERTYTYNANGSLQMITSVFGEAVTEIKYYYHLTGVLDYVVTNEGDPTMESKTIYTFQNSRIVQSVLYNRVPSVELNKTIYEYNSEGFTQSLYVYPYWENAVDPTSPLKPPTSVITKTFYTDLQVLEGPVSWEVSSVHNYLPWSFDKSSQKLPGNEQDNTATYEFDAHDRVTKKTIVYPNWPGGSKQDIHTYEY